MNEDFLHYIWKFGLFDMAGLKTTTGDEVTVLHRGTHNRNAGPDFFNSRIKIGDTTWAGNVEIHTRTSDWARHKHGTDPAYSNIILHVVFEDDKPLADAQNNPVATIELKGRIDLKFYNTYKTFTDSKGWIPCAGSIANVDPFIVENWLERMAVERLERKSKSVLETLALNKGSWQETFYQIVAANFGFKVNAEPFGLLARSIPENYFARQKASDIQIEAMLFGVAGLLEAEFVDEYPNKLKQEFKFLKTKYNLPTLPGHIWKFSRLRPDNFPTVRLAQFAALIIKSNGLFAKVLETKRTEELRELFDVKASGYWDNHYMFDKESAPKEKHMGAASVENIFINSLVPTLFAYGIEHSDEYYRNRSLKLLTKTNPESNTIVKGWQALNVPMKNAHNTQGGIELKNLYCDEKKCLLCSIGTHLLKNGR